MKAFTLIILLSLPEAPPEHYSFSGFTAQECRYYGESIISAWSHRVTTPSASILYLCEEESAPHEENSPQRN